jgi:Xaa-Pro aminopeptidase
LALTLAEKIFQELNSPVVIAGHKLVQSSADGTYPFLQESNLFYLTSLLVPGSYYIFLPPQRHIIVSPTLSSVETAFLGAPVFPEGYELLDFKAADELLDNLSRQNDTVYLLKDDSDDEDTLSYNNGPSLIQKQLEKKFANSKDVRPIIAKARAIKSPLEIDKLKEAVAITNQSFNLAKGRISELQFEYELEAEFTYSFRRSNAQHAYDPIVAGGKNALVLHYNENSQALPKNGLVLIDIGARISGYAADITRTYAIGTPSPREKAVHAAVEKAHFKIIDLIKPGVALKDYQNRSDEIMKEALKSLGLLTKPEEYRKYFPHAISHGLGIDVHESLGGYKEFMPGMVLTVEPGIYIPEEGIGVRIEDDILVTETGNENLSAELSTAL